MSGFQHLDVDLGGAEQGFDLGYKFALEDLARTPFLLLYVSYCSTGPGPVARGSLQFADRQADDKARPPAAVAEQLLQRAKPSLARKLRAITAGQRPETSEKNPEYV